MLLSERLRIPMIILAAQLCAPGALHAISPKITFTRTMPARHDLGGANSVTVIYAIGDSDKVETFVAVLVDQVSLSPLRATDATRRGPRFVGERPDKALVKKLRREFPSDVYLGVNVFTCSSKPGEAELGVRDVDGARVRRKRLWIDAVCTARIDIMDGTDLKRLFSYSVRGEGTSPRVDEITDEVRDIALEQAARFAAVEASELITPRELRETIELDPAAPDLADGLALIEVEKYEEARELWETALLKNASSAALHFNLAAISEAMGDREAATRYFEEARRLAPNESRYKIEGRRFQRRPKSE